MSRVTRLMKLRRRKGSTHHCRMARQPAPRFYFGTGEISLVSEDGSVTRLGVLRDISYTYEVPPTSATIWGTSSHCICLDDAAVRRALSGVRDDDEADR